MQDVRKSGADSTEYGGSATSGSPKKSFRKARASQSSIQDPGLRPRDAIIIIAEMLLSYSWHTIRSRQVLVDCLLSGFIRSIIKIDDSRCYRRSSVRALQSLGMTQREEATDYLFWEGWGAFGSLFVGFMVDSYINCYFVALFNTLFHFVLSSLIFMEEAIMLFEDENPYFDYISSIVTGSFMIFRSTDFARLVFALENLETSLKPSVVRFLFLFTWVSDGVTSGGVLMSVMVAAGHTSSTKLACTGFAFSGISMFLFLFPLRPYSSEKQAEMANLGRRVASCISSAVANKWRYRHSDVKKGSWVEFAGSKWDTYTLRRSKELVSLFIKLLPASGFTLFISASFDDIYQSFFMKLKPTAFLLSDGMYSGMRIIVLITMLLSQFALLPLFKLVGIKDKFHTWFLIGNFFGVLAFFYVAAAFSMIKTDKYGSSEGYVRIFNAREDNVSMYSVEPSFTQLNFTIESKKAIMVQYQFSQVRLFKMQVVFPKITMPIHFSVAESECTGYVIVDPPDIIRIRGYLPLREGPPGTNTFMYPRIYVFHASSRLKNVTVTISDSSTQMKVTSFVIFRGKTFVLQLNNGSYHVKASYVPQRFAMSVKAGGVYGLFIYSSKKNHRIALDQPVTENTTPAFRCLGFLFLRGAGLTFGYVTLRAITYLNAPRGLYGTSFGYLSLMEQLAKWFMMIGFNTWHRHVDPHTLFAYAFITMASFLFSIFIFLKYKGTYEW